MRCIIYFFLVSLGVASHAADLTHTYTFSRGLNDSTGLVDLEGNGGFIGAGRYQFGPNQGLTLRDALADPGSYSIEVAMHYDTPQSFYTKLVDFEELSSDNGLYVAGEQFILYPLTSESSTNVAPGTDFVFVLVQEAQGATRGYVNGATQFTIGGGGNAVPSTNVLNLLLDDIATSQLEAASGSIDYVRVYDGALTGPEVAVLTPPVPNILGDTIFAVLNLGPGTVNLWNLGGPAPAIVNSPGIEYDNLITVLFDLNADFEQNRLTLTLTGGPNDVALAPLHASFTDLDFETDIVDLAVISNTFVNGPTQTAFSANGIDVTLPSGFIASGQEFELVLEIVTQELSDMDGDGVDAAADNCLLAANPGQRDSDGDGFGNACDADLNNDCVVNATDLGLLRTAFFATAQSPNWNPDADFNGDDAINAQDLGILRALFFAPPGPSGVGECT